ncbi:PucR family transcriptional regulator [Nonomuraea sp. NPDC048826]|uniref:PucR family transcriptional regulator n=1 Tax=Nonomuraea sp. NPDC048826 TaxID=3364347 RepID=UPI003714C289
MAPSLQVVARRTGLRPLAGSLDRDVRWVAVSELEDPTPFLEGGELVLTTGMRLTSDFDGYVGRLMARGVAGLGVAVGLTHEEVPPALVAAAGAAGLPLLEVPRETPFISVTKAVSDLLAAEQYEEVTRAFAAQAGLTRAALHPDGTHAVIDRLARELDGWAALFDDAGDLLHATRGARTGMVAAAIKRLRGRGTEAERAPATLALAEPGENVVVQPVGGGPRPRGFFAVGTARAFTPVSHTVVNAAGSLLTLALEQGSAQLEGSRRVRDAVLRLLLSERPSALAEARTVLGPLGPGLPDEPVIVLVAGEESLEALESLAFTARLPPGPVAADPPARERSGAVVVIVEESRMAEVAGAVTGGAGIGGPCSYRGLRAGVEQARLARERGGGRVLRFDELAGQGLVALVEPEAARAFATAKLAPLAAYGSRADLVGSLRAYLESNGHWDAAAQRLGVHRHTLRYRMRRVAELLGRDLDDPGVRAELWFALEAAGQSLSAEK